MAKKRVYSFVDKKYSANSIASLVLGLVGFGLLLFLLLVSYWLKGIAGSWIGAGGITGIVMALMGLRYGFLGFQDDCKSYFCSKFGTIISTVAVVGWFFVVCIGIVNMMQ
ncbi:MAG: DUF6142 family protein [Lachnospiraceae bacterium]|nr:DUF6142 family protein [Lachnospiraceae bacterium]